MNILGVPAEDDGVFDPSLAQRSCNVSEFMYIQLFRILGGMFSCDISIKGTESEGRECFIAIGDDTESTGEG